MPTPPSLLPEAIAAAIAAAATEETAALPGHITIGGAWPGSFSASGETEANSGVLSSGAIREPFGRSAVLERSDAYSAGNWRRPCGRGRHAALGCGVNRR